MIHSVFSVYDAKAAAFLPPFILPKTQMAQRIFSDCVNSVEHQFGKHPEDYTLFHLGTFDDDTGEYLANPASKQSLGNGIEYLDLSHQASDPEGKSNGQIRDEAPVLSGATSGDSA